MLKIMAVLMSLPAGQNAPRSGTGKPLKKKLFSQNKGQKNEVKLFLDSAKSGGGSPISLAEIYSASEVCFAVLESIRSGRCMKLSAPRE